MFGIGKMVLWLIVLLFDYFDSQKKPEASKLRGNIMDFYH